MIQNDVRELLATLLARSLRGEVNWVDSSEMGGPDQDFTVNLPASSINVWESDDGFFGNIRNSEGRVVLEFDGAGSMPDTSLLKNLLEAARRKVLRADEALADIGKALGSTSPVGLESKDSKKRKSDDDDLPF